MKEESKITTSKQKESESGSRFVDSSVVLIVLDGWGIAPASKYNAISLARTPNFDRISEEFGATSICASGKCVGLSEGQMGNSEVGHLTIGSGRIIFQDLMRVNEEISSGRIAENPSLVRILRRISGEKDSTLHLLGLVSNGGVHSHIDHLFGILKIARDFGVKKVAVHVFLDGRDTPPKSGIDFVGSLQSYLKTLGLGFIATISGRFYAMDRDNRWERTKLAYDAIVHGKGEHFEDPVEAVRTSYERGVTDEFVIPRVIGKYGGIKDSDAIFFFNFRPDRARQLTKALALTEEEFQSLFDRGVRPGGVEILTMTIYDTNLKGVEAILEREHVSDTLSNVLENHGIKQLHIAETEKYAHVTYFFNGLTEKPREFEDRILVPSAREVGTYDKKPEMSAEEITKNALTAITSRNYGFILINYANADMVGHSGDINATVRAVETVDSCLGRIYETWKSIMKGGDGEKSEKEKNKREDLSIIITADHGNAEMKLDPETGQPHTAHTSNPVPLILVSEKWRVSVPDGYSAGLIDIAPSVLRMIGIAEPKAMTGIPIVELKSRENP